jgi:WD40 repeat protein
LLELISYSGKFHGKPNQIMKQIKRLIFRLLVLIYIFPFLVVHAQNEPELILPIGHTVQVNSAQFSPDGKYIVTTSYDNTAKIWDAASGKMLQDLSGHTQWVNSAQFSPDGKFIVTSSRDNSAIIWDAASGKMLQDLSGHIDWVLSAQFSPDGKYIVTASEDNTAKIWDAASGKILQDLSGHINGVNSAQFSPDGKYILTASDDNIAKIWDAASGKILQDLSGHIYGVNSAQFSPDGKYIVTASSNFTTIWDAASGKMLQYLFGHTRSVNSAQFSPDGKYIVTTSYDNIAKIWDTSSGIMLQDLSGHTDYVGSAQFSPDGKYIVTASGDHTAKIWDAASGKMLQDLSGHSQWVLSAQFSPDGKYIVTAFGDSTAKIWDAASGKILQDLSGHTDYVGAAKFSPDGKYIVTASLDNTAKIWDAASGKVLQDLSGHTQRVYSAQFSPDGKYIVTSSRDNTAKIWDAASGKILQDLSGHTLSVNSAKFSPDGKYILTASGDHTAKIWDAASGKILQDLSGHAQWVNSAQFSPDGKYIVTSSRDNTAKIWDAASGKILQVLSGHTDYVGSPQFSPDGKYIVTASLDNTAKIWDAASGKLLYTRLQLEGGDWLVYDEYFHYGGSEGARDNLYFVCGLEIIDLAQMKDALYVPGLAEKIMNGEDINYPKLSDLDICGTLPLVEKISEDDNNYHYKIIPRVYGFEEVEVDVNDKLTYTFSKSELTKKESVFILEMETSEITKHFLAGEDNEVKVIAIAKFRGNELKSRGAVTVTSNYIPERVADPKLYAVMIGINDYKDDNLDLNFPSKDATDLSNTIELSAKELLGNDNVFMYQVNSNSSNGDVFTTPEKEGIRRALEDIGKKAEPQDVILIFFAGHGAMIGDEEKTFTFLTAEASNYNPIGITTKELQNWLSYEGPHKIKANKTILIIDACHSGQVTQELLALARNDEETERIRQVEDLKDKSGMFILAASAANQSAYELPQYEQGLLTYSLLHTIKNNPDILDDDKYLNVQKWFLESEDYLKQLVSSLGYEQDAQPFGSANIRIGEVNEEVKNSIHLAEEKPLIICSNVTNMASPIESFQLKRKINARLNEISERGTEKPFIYVSNETPNANLIDIRYTISGTTINCTVYLIKKGSLLHQIDIKGNSDNVDALVAQIVVNAAEHAK